VAQHPPPHWQPISKLPLITAAIDGLLEGAEEQYQLLQQAQPKPYVLDDDTVGRVITVFAEQRDDLWLYEEQLRRWAGQEFTEAQRREVGRVTGRLERLRQVIAAILELADELKGGTIERVLAKDDAELGLEFLLRHLSGHDPLE